MVESERESKITKIENHNVDYFSINWYSKVNVF